MQKLLINFLLLLGFFSPGFAQSDTSLKFKDEKFISLWKLQFEHGLRLGNSYKFSNKFEKSTYYNGLDFHLGFHKKNFSVDSNKKLAISELKISTNTDLATKYITFYNH